MKIGTHEIANKWVYLMVAILLAVFLLILSMPSFQKPITPQQTISEVKAELEKQYKTDIDKKEAEIKNYQSRLTLSEGRYKVLVDKYVDIEKRKQNVIAPKNNEELRNRFTALGYIPLK